MANFFADLFTGGAASRNEQAKNSTNIQREQIKKTHDFNWAEALRKYDYAVEGLNITKRNTENNLKFQEASREQQYQYGMGIREYEHIQNTRAFDLSVARAVQQQSFNELAKSAALVDQDRLIQEQLLSIAFDETESLLNYGMAAAGLGLKKRQARGAALTEVQATRISALKAAGQAQARGAAGQSSAKVVQGLIAESGARQAAIVDALMYSTEGIDSDFIQLSKQFAIDQVAFETSKESAQLSDIAARNRIAQQFLQATINAEASIALKPEIAPPLPKPIALPRPIFQDIYKPQEPPMTVIPDAAQENLFTAGFNTVAQYASMAAGMGAFSGIGAGAGAGAGAGSSLSGISSASSLGGASYGMGAASGAFTGATGLGGTSWGGLGSFGGSFGVGRL